MACVAGLIGAASAQAAFPGANGPIAFSPLLLPQDDPSAHSQVSAVGANGTGLTQLTHVADDKAAAMPDTSADGTKIAYESNESGPFEIWTMNANGSGQTQLTHRDGFEAFLPSWSPNGQRIVFSSCGEPLGFPAYCDIDVMNADGSGVKKLVGGRRFNLRAVYSPNGRTIAFQSDRKGLISAVWRVRADGSHPRRLTAPGLEAYWPDWSPNGQTILFSDNWDRPNSSLWTVGADGKGAKTVSRPRRTNRGFGVYSPDGQRIVFTGCDPDCQSLETLSADGTNPQPIPGVTADGPPFSADWGPAP
jgi:Tol biopolymer transport system component